MHQS